MISSHAIERLFHRLKATYGEDWERHWSSIPMSDVKTSWAHELGSVPLESIAWALENLPERCPNAIQFKLLCRSAPAPAVELLPLPKADPERVKAELAKLRPVEKPNPENNLYYQKDWARRILASKSGGLPVNPTVLRMAKDALGVE